MSGQVDPTLSLAVQIFGSSPPNEEGTDAQEGLWPQGKHPSPRRAVLLFLSTPGHTQCTCTSVLETALQLPS